MALLGQYAQLALTGIADPVQFGLNLSLNRYDCSESQPWGMIIGSAASAAAGIAATKTKAISLDMDYPPENP